MSRGARVVYDVPRSMPGWELVDETMPESDLHDSIADLLHAILAYWARGRDVYVARNRAVRWDPERPRVGVDPDVCVVTPRPPFERTPNGPPDLRSIRTWVPGHSAPALAIEIVSQTHPHKDYALVPDKYAASGTSELWVFDPLLAGPRSHGGPHLLQIWRRLDEGRFERVHAGGGLAFSTVLDAWGVVLDGSPMLRIANDRDGRELWPTAEEAERQAKETERQAKETERREKEAERAARAREESAREHERTARETAEARVRQLEAELSALRAENGSTPSSRRSSDG